MDQSEKRMNKTDQSENRTDVIVKTDQSEKKMEMDQSERRMDIDLATAIMEEDDIEAFEAVNCSQPETGSSITESSKPEVQPEDKPEVPNVQKPEVQPEVQECQVVIAPWEKQVCDNFTFPKVSLHRLCQKCPSHVFKLDFSH